MSIMFLLVFWFGRDVFLNLPPLSFNEWIIFTSVLCSFLWRDAKDWMRNK